MLEHIGCTLSAFISFTTCHGSAGWPFGGALDRYWLFLGGKFVGSRKFCRVGLILPLWAHYRRDELLETSPPTASHAPSATKHQHQVLRTQHPPLVTIAHLPHPTMANTKRPTQGALRTIQATSTLAHHPPRADHSSPLTHSSEAGPNALQAQNQLVC